MAKNNVNSTCQFPETPEFAQGNAMTIINFVFERKPIDYETFFYENHFTFFLIVSGTCDFSTDYETFSLKKGDCCFAFPQKRFKFTNNDNSKWIYISFTNPEAKHLLDSFDITYTNPVRRGLTSCVPFFVKEFARSEQLESPYLIPHSLLEHALSFFFVPKKHLPEHVDKTTLVNNIVSYVNAHYNEKINLEEIAKENFISYNYLSQLFKQHTGTTFSKHIINVRLHKAKDYLLRTKAPISKIAYSCGFFSINYFNRLFKEYYIITPKEYRKLHAITSNRK